jgi:hypothetical protein
VLGCDDEDFDGADFDEVDVEDVGVDDAGVDDACVDDVVWLAGRPSSRVSLRFTWARRRPWSRFPAALALASSLTLMLLTTRRAPAVLAILVAEPLCWTTLVEPSQ